MRVLGQPEQVACDSLHYRQRTQDRSISDQGCPNAVISRWGSSLNRLQQARNEDQESGETTGRRIIVLRKPPTLQEQISVRLQQKVETSGKYSSLQHKVDPSAQCGISEISSSVSRSSRSKKGRVSKTFRVPSVKTESKSKTKGGLCVNAWKEYLLGTSVLHPKIITFDRWENGCDTWYKLWCAYTGIISSCSYYSLWIKRLFLYTLRIFLPITGGKIYFCYFRHNHISIHKKGEEQSLNIKFHGSPFQGVTLYFARICCPFCAAESQQMLAMKYFQSTVTERRYMMGRNLDT